jgi:hypothetical protein
LRCCRNCRFYDPGAPQQCREPQAEPVRDKEAGNYCDFFEPLSQHAGGERDRAVEAKRKLEDLFRKCQDP